jgi:hypothetical protein
LVIRGYDEVKEFSEGMAPVCAGEKWGYVNVHGDLTIPCTFDAAEGFSEGLAVVRVGDKYGYVSKSGTVVVECSFRFASTFHEGIAVVARIAPDPPARLLYGFITRQGKAAIAPHFDRALRFSEGVAWVRVPTNAAGQEARFAGRWATMDRAGTLLCAPDMDVAIPPWNPASEGTLLIARDRVCRFLDFTGKEVLPSRWRRARMFSEGLAGVEIPQSIGYRWGFIDTTGKVVLPPIFQDVEHFSEGLCAAKLNGQWGFIDHSGVFVISPQFRWVVNFVGGYARVICFQGAGYVSSDGRFLWESLGRAPVTVDRISVDDRELGWTEEEIRKKYGDAPRVDEYVLSDSVGLKHLVPRDKWNATVKALGYEKDECWFHLMKDEDGRWKNIASTTWVPISTLGLPPLVAAPQNLCELAKGVLPERHEQGGADQRVSHPEDEGQADHPDRGVERKKPIELPAGKKGCQGKKRQENVSGTVFGGS